MSIEQNVQTVKDMPAVQALFADDIELIIPGEDCPLWAEKKNVK
jgi:ketosteroid isomerase-like protein